MYILHIHTYRGNIYVSIKKWGIHIPYYLNWTVLCNCIFNIIIFIFLKKKKIMWYTLQSMFIL